jgi:hypothetical protein
MERMRIDTKKIGGGPDDQLANSFRNSRRDDLRRSPDQ